MTAGVATTDRGTVLVVDDDEDMREALAAGLRALGHHVEIAADAEAAIAVLDGLEPDVVLTDLHMPGGGGLAVVRQGLAKRPHTAFVVLTAFGTIDVAVEAVKCGAEQFLAKPVDLVVVQAVVARAVARAKERFELSALRSEARARDAKHPIVGNHPSMQRVLELVERVAPSRSTVLLTGETGTGKERVAAAIHRASPRAAAPFVRLNCAAVAEPLLESELFGHEKGAFTGAVRRRDGKFQQAHQGTLFLDEISEIPLPLQVKLLRFLQEREFERVGGDETLRVDARFIAATNRPLRPLVEDHQFREDLFYRLNVVEILLPPLRARVSDIPTLALHFLRVHAEENGRTLTGFTEDALALLCAYSWPGNVRELQNVVERAVVLSDGPQLTAELFAGLRVHAKRDAFAGLIPGISLAELERLAIERTLDAVGGSTARAAEILGISQRKIQYKLHEWGGGAVPSGGDH